jgi:hypothetical protein
MEGLYVVGSIVNFSIRSRKCSLWTTDKSANEEWSSLLTTSSSGRHVWVRLLTERALTWVSTMLSWPKATTIISLDLSLLWIYFIGKYWWTRVAHKMCGFKAHQELPVHQGSRRETQIIGLSPRQNQLVVYHLKTRSTRLGICSQKKNMTWHTLPAWDSVTLAS